MLLVDGDQRVSQAIKYLTMSSWSHSALYVGDALLGADPATRADVQRRFGREARYLIVEALVDKGVVVSPLVKYIDFNIRICRPVGLTPRGPRRSCSTTSSRGSASRTTGATSGTSPGTCCPSR